MIGSSEVLFNDLPPPIAEPLRACLDAGRRFYVAALPDSPGVLRHKDAAGLHEWQTRQWTYFSRRRQPEIHDVTADMPGIWRTLVTRPRRYSRGSQDSMWWFLECSGLAFRWADRRLVLYDGATPERHSDVTDHLTINELLGLPPVSAPAWTREGVRAARLLACAQKKV